MKESILIITNTSNGLYLFRQDLIQTLLTNYSVYVITGDTGRINELIELGCHVDITEIDRRGMNPSRDLRLAQIYYRKIREYRPRLVITYTIKPNIYGGICCRLQNVPYAVNVTGLGTAFQSAKTRKLINLLYRLALKKVRVIFCENSSIKDELINNGIASGEKICVLSGAGVNLDKFSVIEYPNNDVFKFLFIGRIMKEKGIDELFEAVKRLNEEDCRCDLLLVGGMEEDYSKSIVGMPWIEYKGKQMDVRPFIEMADCFVLPSYHEGMANTNLECAASGRPVITSNIPGCREAVIDGKSGLLCKPKDVDSLYGVMKNMIGKAKKDREQMGMAGRRHMEEKFDKKNVVKETIDHLFTESEICCL